MSKAAFCSVQDNQIIFTPWLYVRNYYKVNIMDLIAKLVAYGFDNTASTLITDYLTNSNLRTFYLNG